MSCRQALQERELSLGQRQPAVGALPCYQCSAASLPCAVALSIPCAFFPVLQPFPPSLCRRGKPLLQPHHLRSPAQLVAIVKMVILAAGIAAVHPGTDSYIQCCLLILLYGCERNLGWLGVAWLYLARRGLAWLSSGSATCWPAAPASTGPLAAPIRAPRGPLAGAHQSTVLAHD